MGFFDNLKAIFGSTPAEESMQAPAEEAQPETPDMGEQNEAPAEMPAEMPEEESSDGMDSEMGEEESNDQ